MFDELMGLVLPEFDMPMHPWIVGEIFISWNLRTEIRMPESCQNQNGVSVVKPKPQIVSEDKPRCYEGGDLVYVFDRKN